MAKLSDVIGIGMSGRYAIPHALFHIPNRGVIGATITGCCTLGAAMIGALGETRCLKDDFKLFDDFATVHPEISSVATGAELLDIFKVPTLVRGVSAKSLRWALVYLNDQLFIEPENVARALGKLGH